jgi:hypothetical protein
LLGGYDIFGKDTVTKTFDLPPIPHNEIRILVRLVQIDDWEDKQPGKDELILKADGRTIATKTFSGDDGQQRCGQSSQGSEKNYESIAWSAKDISSSKQTLELTVEGKTNESKKHESWGLDIVQIWVK